VVLRREVERGRLADAPHLDGLLVGEAVGRVLGRRVGHACEQVPAARVGCGELLLELL